VALSNVATGTASLLGDALALVLGAHAADRGVSP
jgi:hypothetical protein